MSQISPVDPAERAKMIVKCTQLTIRDDTSLFDIAGLKKEYLEYSVRDIPGMFTDQK